MSNKGRFSRRRDGSVAVRLGSAEVDLVRNTARSIRELIDAESADPVRDRLFPPAYPDDETAQREWRALTHDDLLDGRRRAIETVLTTLEAGRTRRGTWEGVLDPDQTVAWLGLLNDARLVLGMRLDVTEDMYETPPPPGDPRRAGFEVYAYLGWLESELLDALDPGLLEEVEGTS